MQLNDVPLAERDLRRFRASMRTLQQLLKQRLRSCCRGVTLAQCHVLMELDAQGAATPGSLARVLYLDKSTLSRTVEGLVRRGLVRRATDRSDRRVTPLSLTSRGKRTCDSLHSVNDQLFQAIFARIPRRGRAAVVREFVQFVEAFAALDDARDEPAAECATGGSP